MMASCASQQRSGDAALGSADSCPERTDAQERLPGTKPEHLTLRYWLDRYSDRELDQPLMSVAAVAAYNSTTGRKPGTDPEAQRDLLARPDRTALLRSVRERLDFMRGKIERGEFVSADAQAVPKKHEADLSAIPELLRKPPLYVASAPAQIRCAPYPGSLLAADSVSGGFDRNACSTIRAQEVVQTLGTSPSGMQLVRTAYAFGWLPSDAPLVPLPRTQRLAFVSGPRAWSSAEARWPGGGSTHKHVTLPLAGPDTVLLATPAGVVERPRLAAHEATRRPLTRRRLLTAAFSFLDSPYGLGGQGGGRDCSRLMMDLFGSFDLALPRHSGWQAKAGTRAVDLPSRMSDEDKLRRIDALAKDAVVLLYLPGHIMLYLGRDRRGTPMVLHALGEYAAPCRGGGETVRDVRRTIVSNLELGRGSSRTSLIERVTRIVGIGAEGITSEAAPPNLQAVKRCRDTTDTRIFYSPKNPRKGDRLRAIATAETDPGQVRLALWDPQGNLVQTHERVLSGPPTSRWVEAKADMRGRYTAVLGTADRIIACKRIPVRRRAQEEPLDAAERPVWAPRWKWERDTENLWSAFVEQLFDYPADDARTWTDLHSLLRDQSRNLLHNHLGLAEDNTLTLQPDCADLPYVLRAYFAWKLQLPFGFRQCTRGRPNKPPRCGPPRTHLEPREAAGDLAAFAHFANRRVRSGVHSASGRTHPKDDETDYYPVDLTRSSLRPGTIYADPYGHVMMLSKWFPQGPDGSSEYGVLMAAEAQPDGTVGRRRFWEGSFLFDPSTKHVGAGFKQFRPLVFDEVTGELRALPNREIDRRSGFSPFGMKQYGLDKVGFYDHMDGLINPRPRSPVGRMDALIDALQESVTRRITALSNGEEFMRGRAGRTLEMPSGYSLFETIGPWEDFSTPARDMRLLVSIDTVLGFPARVARNPKRFIVEGKRPDVAGLRQHMEESLAGHRFEYTRSDGSSFALTLADVVQRSKAFEMAYNPNDCVELRWGAAPNSEEAAPCKRRTPSAQQARMTQYRPWFEQRARPPRGTR